MDTTSASPTATANAAAIAEDGACPLLSENTPANIIDAAIGLRPPSLAAVRAALGQAGGLAKLQENARQAYEFASFGQSAGSDMAASRPARMLDNDWRAVHQSLGAALTDFARARILLAYIARWQILGLLSPAQRAALDERYHATPALHHLFAHFIAPDFDAIPTIVRLTGKGVTLAVSDAGDLTAGPAVLLNAQDRAILKEQREAFIATLEDRLDF